MHSVIGHSSSLGTPPPPPPLPPPGPPSPHEAAIPPLGCEAMGDSGRTFTGVIEVVMAELRACGFDLTRSGAAAGGEDVGESVT